MKAILLLSGGLDSQVLLAWAMQEPYQSIDCLGFNYGQRHLREVVAALSIARYYGRPFQVVLLPHLQGSPLTGPGDVPKGLPWDHPQQATTVVPNRNAVMLSAAAAIAVKRQMSCVLFAAHRGDAAIYPDCRPEFVDLFDRATFVGCGVNVQAPFLQKTKREIVQLGRQLHVPMEMSYSCYEGQESPCGECGACIERKEALA